MYTKLTLSGGGLKSIMELGALDYLYNNIDMKSIKYYSGVSAGAIICFLLIIGYSPTELIQFLVSTSLFEKLRIVNIVQLLNNGGVLSFTPIYEVLEELTIKKIGYIPTFSSLYTKFEKELIVTTFNINAQEVEYLSRKTTPDLPITIALRMSCTLPVVFSPFKYNETYYIDGGLGDNIPSFKFLSEDIVGKDSGEEIVLYIPSTTTHYEHNGEYNFNLLDYMSYLLHLNHSKQCEHKFSSLGIDNDNITKFRLEGGKDIEAVYQFQTTVKSKLDLFSVGLNIAKETMEDLS